ncbi:unnamed protein product, partial [Prunus brigantina]
RPVVGIGAEEEPSVVEVTSSDEGSEEEPAAAGGAQPEVELGTEEEAEDPDLARIDLDGVPPTASGVGDPVLGDVQERPAPTVAPVRSEVDGISRRRPSSNEPEFAEDDPMHVRAMEEASRYRAEHKYLASGELSEDEEGQLEVIRSLEASARDAAELLSHSSLSASGLLDPITEAMGIDRNDPRARQLLEKLLKKGPGPSGSVRTGPP